MQSLIQRPGSHNQGLPTPGGVQSQGQMGHSLGLALAEQIKAGNVLRGVRRIPAGSHLFRMGDTSDWIYLIRCGWAKSITSSPQGKLCMLDVEGPGSVLGAIKDPSGSRSEDVITKTEVTFNVIRSAEFERCLASQVFSTIWHSHMIDLMSERQRMLVTFVTLDSERRLAATLVQLATKWGVPHSGAKRLLCPLTHEELGQMVGTTRSRIGYFINRFHADGLLVKTGDGLALHTERLTRYVHS